MRAYRQAKRSSNKLAFQIIWLFSKIVKNHDKKRNKKATRNGWLFLIV